MRVVVLGGGYGGLYAFKALRRHRKRIPGLDIVLVSRDPYHTYHGWTGEVLSGRLRGEETFSPLEPLLNGGRFLHGSATAVDVDARTASVRHHDGTTEELSYDHLVIATGSKDPLDRIPGSTEHACRMKDSHDLLRLERRLDDLCGEEPSTEGIDVVVVGSGFSGVETAAAMAARLGRRARVRIVASGAGILPDVRVGFPKLVSSAERILREAGVEILTGGRVARICGDHVVMEDGRTVPSDVAVIAAGIGFDVLPGTEPLRRRDGRIVVDEFTKVPGDARIWAVGDAASVPQANGEGPCPTSAIWAMRQGEIAGVNVARSILGRPLRRFSFRGFGQAAGLGSGKAIAELHGIQMHGWPASLIRLGFFAWYMPSRRAGASLLRRLLMERAA